jgi:hypothetical protein
VAGNYNADTAIIILFEPPVPTASVLGIHYKSSDVYT